MLLCNWKSDLKLFTEKTWEFWKTERVWNRLFIALMRIIFQCISCTSLESDHGSFLLTTLSFISYWATFKTCNWVPFYSQSRSKPIALIGISITSLNRFLQRSCHELRDITTVMSVQLESHDSPLEMFSFYHKRHVTWHSTYYMSRAVHVSHHRTHVRILARWDGSRMVTWTHLWSRGQLPGHVDSRLIT